MSVNVPNGRFWTFLRPSVLLATFKMFQSVCFYTYSHFARPPSSEMQFSMTKRNPRFVCKSFSLDMSRANRTMGVDPQASHMCSKSLSLDARRSNCVSDTFIYVVVMCSFPLSLDARRSKCVSYMFKCVLARRLSIQMRFLCAQMCSRSTPVNLNEFFYML